MNPRNKVHAWAAAGGATAGALPIPADIAALQAEEIMMVIRIAECYGVSLSESAAEGIIAAYLGGLIGPVIFETLNIGYPFTIPAKIVTAVGIIEALGNTACSYFEKTYA